MRHYTVCTACALHTGVEEKALAHGVAVLATGFRFRCLQPCCIVGLKPTPPAVLCMGICIHVISSNSVSMGRHSPI